MRPARGASLDRGGVLGAAPRACRGRGRRADRGPVHVRRAVLHRPDPARRARPRAAALRAGARGRRRRGRGARPARSPGSRTGCSRRRISTSASPARRRHPVRRLRPGARAARPRRAMLAVLAVGAARRGARRSATRSGRRRRRAPRRRGARAARGVPRARAARRRPRPRGARSRRGTRPTRTRTASSAATSSSVRGSTTSSGSRLPRVWHDDRDGLAARVRRPRRPAFDFLRSLQDEVPAVPDKLKGTRSRVCTLRGMHAMPQPLLIRAWCVIAAGGGGGAFPASTPARALTCRSKHAVDHGDVLVVGVAPMIRSSRLPNGPPRERRGARRRRTPIPWRASARTAWARLSESSPAAEEG